MEPRAGGLSLLLCPVTYPLPPHSRPRAAGAAVGAGLGRGSGLRRSAHSGGLAGRRLHVNKSRTLSDICREPCCPYTHSFFTPRGRFVTGGGLPICRRCADLGCGRGSRPALGGGGVDSLGARAGPEAPAALAVSLGSRRGGGRGSSGPVPVAVLVSALPQSEPAVALRQLPGARLNVAGLAGWKRRARGRPQLCSLMSLCAQREGVVRFSCPPLAASTFLCYWKEH